MHLFVILISIVLILILIITVFKINPFIAFLLVSVVAGVLLGIPLTQVATSIEKGIGDMAGSTLIVLCSGAMIGKLVAESGAAKVIADTMMRIFGEKYIQWGMLCSGFVIGVPLFYNVGFVLVVPIIFTLIYQYKLPPIFVALPMLASLSVAHGFLPPHPSPSVLIAIFHANMGRTFLFGIILAIPAIILAGPVFSKLVKNIQPLHELPLISHSKVITNLPGVFNSFFSALFPVFLLIITTISINFLPANSYFVKVAGFISSPSILMILAVVVTSFSLGIFYGKTIKNIMNIFEAGIKDIAILILIISCSGALKQVLADSGTSDQIAVYFQHLPIHPLILGWLLAATLRVCLGSATVAGLTTAGIIAPLLHASQVDASLMVLSIGSGSLMFSHVNDPGFWMFKEYFQLSMKDTFRSWSLMETIISIVGLIGVMILHALI